MTIEECIHVFQKLLGGRSPTELNSSREFPDWFYKANYFKTPDHLGETPLYEEYDISQDYCSV